MPLAAMAAITIGTQVAGAIAKHKAANAANKAQQAGADKALDLQKTQRDESMARLAPFANGSHSMAALLGGAQTPYSTPAPYVGPGAGGVGGQPVSNVRQYNEGGMAQAPPWAMPRSTSSPGMPPPPPPSGVTPPGSGYAVPLQVGAQSTPPPGMNYRYQPNGPPPAYGAGAPQAMGPRLAGPSPGVPPPPQQLPITYQPQYLGQMMT